MNSLDFDSMRQAMVSNQLRTTAVNDSRVLDALRTVPREEFVPVAQRFEAYSDSAISLGSSRSLAPPMATARLLNEANVARDDCVLLIGLATGYAAALFAQLAASIVAVEEDAALLDQARRLLGDNERITLVSGPLNKGHARPAPYDLIFIDGAITHVPEVLVDQLVDGGRIVTGLNDGPVTRLARGVKAGGGISFTSFADVACPTLPGFERTKEFVF